MLVNLLVQPGIPALSITPVYNALRYIVNIVNPRMSNPIDIQNLGYWRPDGYQDGTRLIPHGSINWFLEMAYKERLTEDSINSGTILREAKTYSLKNSRCPLTVFVLDNDIVHPTVGWGIGATSKFWCSVINISRFKVYDDETQSDLIRTLALHECGHLFGLVDENRKSFVVDALGKHCTRDGCVMRQGPTIPDWLRMSQESKKHNLPYCIQCQTELLENTSKLKSR